MKLKVTLPESIKEVSLNQYQRFYKLTQREDLSQLNFNKRKIEIFTELNYKQVGKIPYQDYTDIIEQIDKAINIDYGFEQRFFIGDVEFGFIPNLDKITTGEFADLSKWGVDVDNLHRVMAILFRPIVTTDAFGNYQIAAYNGTDEFHEIMRRTPMHIVNGALDFFYNLAKELRVDIQRYTNRELMKEAKHQAILKSGVGMPPSLN